jgi:Leucine-rich repeat (LRR) protein
VTNPGDAAAIREIRRVGMPVGGYKGFRGWETGEGDPCSEWVGVVCDGDGRVTELHTCDWWGLGTCVLNVATFFALRALPNRINLPALRVLDLTNSQLEAIPPGAFSQLEQLTLLSLCRNQLSSISLQALLPLERLSRLDLSSNQLTVIPPGAFATMKKLARLNLSNNQLTAIPPDAFSSLKQLTDLNIAANKLTFLPPGVFSSLEALWNLELSSNNLSSIPPDAFQSLARLTALDLSYNHLLSIPPGALSSLSDLNSLALSNNRLSSIESDAFAYLNQLLALYLSNNQLTSIPPGAFSSLKKLNQLYLVNNQLTSIPPDTFSSLTELKLLHLSNNQLTAIPLNAFSNLMQLTDLDLSNNRLLVLPPGAFSSLRKLTLLDLSHNQLTSIQPGTFSSLEQLWELNLSDNRLSSMPTGIFGASRGSLLLQYLHLARNAMQRLPRDLFHDMTALVDLDLQQNQLSSLPDLPFGIKKLRLSDNRLTTLPAIGHMSQLTWLDANANMDMTGAIPCHPRLEILLVSTTRVHDVPTDDSQHTNDTACLPNLVTANVANTGVKFLRFLSSSRQLQGLDASGNSIDQGNMAVLKDSTSLLSVHLENCSLKGSLFHFLDSTLPRSIETVSVAGNHALMGDLDGRSWGFFFPHLAKLSLDGTGVLSISTIFSQDQAPNLVDISVRNTALGAISSQWRLLSHVDTRGSPGMTWPDQSLLRRSVGQGDVVVLAMNSTCASAIEYGVTSRFTATVDPDQYGFQFCECLPGHFGDVPRDQRACAVCPPGGGQVSVTCESSIMTVSRGVVVTNGALVSPVVCPSDADESPCVETTVGRVPREDVIGFLKGDVATTCREGHDGSSRLCSRCARGWYASGRQCRRCSHGTWWVKPLAMLVILTGLGVKAAFFDPSSRSGLFRTLSSHLLLFAALPQGSLQLPAQITSVFKSATRVHRRSACALQRLLRRLCGERAPARVCRRHRPPRGRRARGAEAGQ